MATLCCLGDGGRLGTAVLPNPARTVCYRSGKGTQCGRIHEQYGWTHVSAGDLLREAVEHGADLVSRILVANTRLVCACPWRKHASDGCRVHWHGGNSRTPRLLYTLQSVYRLQQAPQMQWLDVVSWTHCLPLGVRPLTAPH